jgi:nitrogenase molybdenum-iron protein NifN
VNRINNSEKNSFTSTRNACALCAPLGASLAFRGIENCIPLIHGSQGCSTYIRRYIISHFREPIDIASSNFSEETAIFGGGENLKTALDNVIRQYNPSVVGVASTCLSETIGDDVKGIIREYMTSGRGGETPVVQVSTPSYKGTHAEGFRSAVRSTVEYLAGGGDSDGSINLFPPIISPEDIRHLKEILYAFRIKGVILPDYSDSMDGGTWESYNKLSGGGTTIEEIRNMGRADASIDIGSHITPELSTGKYISEKFGNSLFRTGLPLGIDGCDRFFSILAELSGRPVPEKFTSERSRLADAYIDAHKYLSGKRAVVYGEPDLASGIAGFLEETGVKTVLCATGSRGMSAGFSSSLPHIDSVKCGIEDDTDFSTMLELCRDLKPDMVIGSSKGFYLSKNLGIPLIRAGFPVHDRFGGQRLMHFGYKGTQQFFDRMVNAVMEYNQNSNNIGYSYI